MSGLVLKVLSVSKATREVRRNRGHAANELVFQVQAPPLGYTTYSVSSLQGRPSSAASPKRGAPTSIQNKVVTQFY